MLSVGSWEVELSALSLVPLGAGCTGFLSLESPSYLLFSRVCPLGLEKRTRRPACSWLQVNFLEACCWLSQDPACETAAGNCDCVVSRGDAPALSPRSQGWVGTVVCVNNCGSNSLMFVIRQERHPAGGLSILIPDCCSFCEEIATYSLPIPSHNFSSLGLLWGLNLANHRSQAPQIPLARVGVFISGAHCFTLKSAPVWMTATLLISLCWPKERATKWNDTRLCASTTEGFTSLTCCYQLRSKTDSCFLIFADKERYSGITILVSVTNTVVGNHKQGSEVWNPADSVAFSIQLDSSHEEQTWMDVDTASCLLNILRPLRKEPHPEIPCLDWCPGVPGKGPFIPAIPFWANLLGSVVSSVVVCSFRTLGPDLNTKVFFFLPRVVH